MHRFTMRLSRPGRGPKCSASCSEQPSRTLRMPHVPPHMIQPTAKKKAATLAAVLALTCTGAQATTYRYTGASFTAFGNYTAAPCSAGSCANFTPALSATGTFSTAVPLAASLPPSTDITPDITSFSFSDGLTTYNSSDPLTNLMRAYAETDATGAVTAIDIYVQRWQSGTLQAVGGRIDTLVLGHASASAYHDVYCTLYSNPPTLAKAAGGTCTGFGQDTNTSFALVNAGALPVPVAGPPSAPSPASVPTLSHFGLLTIGLLACAIGMATVRARPQSAAWRRLS